MTGTGRRIPVRELVCPVGEDAFRLPGGEWPCNSRWVRLHDAAALLEVSWFELWQHRASGGVPICPWGWVSLEWIEGILRTRERVA